MTGIELYPCDRGQKSTLSRGYHNFQATQYGVVCTLCGQRGPEPDYRVIYSNRIEGQCSVCGGFHALGDDEAHPSYFANRGR